MKTKKKIDEKLTFPLGNNPESMIQQDHLLIYALEKSLRRVLGYLTEKKWEESCAEEHTKKILPKKRA